MYVILWEQSERYGPNSDAVLPTSNRSILTQWFVEKICEEIMNFQILDLGTCNQYYVSREYSVYGRSDEDIAETFFSVFYNEWSRD